MGRVHYIQVNYKDGSKRFLSFDRCSRMTLVKTKVAAAKFCSEHQAVIVSNYFWEKLWNKELYETREIIVDWGQVVKFERVKE